MGYGGAAGVAVGRYDPSDFFNASGYASPWTGFQNLSSILDVSIALPDTSAGIGAGCWFGDNVYALGVLNDANGVLTDVSFFEDGAEFWKGAEIGWAASRNERYTRSAHVSVWHVDERDEAGIPSSWGIASTGQWLVGSDWLPFYRAGWSDGDAPLMNRHLSGGIGHRLTARSDIIGLSVSWGDPVDDSLDGQTTVEGFYRLQLAENMAITPSFQYYANPALNPDEDSMWMFGLKARFTL